MCNVVSILMLGLASMPLFAASYTLEPDYTQGVFRWNHLGFTNPAAQFSQGTGTLEFDPSDPTHAAVAVTIPLATLHTGVPALDDDFRSAAFFDTATYPIATFKSTGVTQGSASNRLKVTGALTLHGVTKRVLLDVTIIRIGINPRTNLPTIGFEGTTTLKRSEFGLGKYVPQVADDIQVQIICQAVDANAYEEYLQKKAKSKN